MAETALSIVPQGELETRTARLPNFEPRDIHELELFATIMSKSGLVPKDYTGKLENCMVAMMMGRELGLSPMQALQGISVVNGRPAVWGDALWALVISHPEFEGCEESVTAEEASCKLSRRRGIRVDSITETFSMQDAKTAKLTEKDTPWKTYPKRMMLWRARTYAARTLFADALKGISSYEEVNDQQQFIDAVVDPRPAARGALPAEASAGPAPAASQGDQPKPDADPRISAAQIKVWNDTWNKALNVYKDTLNKAELLEIKRLELEFWKASKSGELKVSQLDASLKRAAEWKPSANPQKEPEQQQAAKPASDATAQAASPAQAEQTDPTEELARSWMQGLNFGPLAIDTHIQRHTVDGAVRWDRLAIELEPKAREAGLLEDESDDQDGNS